mmetsp:Transcript_32073/g.48434  ORF Transcript_32073/g.48434 Transcript_32073/m.48434 type:complete len:324 (-) Transcript_32073:2991-3962(-)
MTESKFKLDNVNSLSQEGTTISGEKHDSNEISRVVQDNSQNPSQQLETGILNYSKFEGIIVHGEKDSDNAISKKSLTEAKNPSQSQETGTRNNPKPEGKTINREKLSDNEISLESHKKTQEQSYLLESEHIHTETLDSKSPNNGREKYDGWKRFYLSNSVGKVGNMQRSRLLASKTVLLDSCSQDLCSFPRREKLVAKKIANVNKKAPIIPPVRIKKTAQTPSRATKTPPKFKKTKPRTPKSTPIPIWVGVPDEKLEGGWPDGWVKKLFERKGGSTKGHRDKYWFSPKTEKKLRSIVEVKKFIKYLEECNGDEDAAFSKLRGK